MLKFITVKLILDAFFFLTVLVILISKALITAIRNNNRRALYRAGKNVMKFI